MQDTELALLIDRFMRRIHAGLQSGSRDFDKQNVGPGGGIVLMTLADMGCCGLNALTQRVARDKSQMTRTMRSLEAKGLVQRKPSPEDGRVSMVELTPAGAVVVTEITQKVAETIEEILRPISQDEKATLKALLARAVP